MNYSDASNYLVTTKKFTSIDSKTLYGTTIDQYKKIKDSVNEFVIKSQFEGNNHISHPTLHYEAKYGNKTYADTLIKQLENAGFKCIEKEADKLKKEWLFRNDKYTAIIYVFPDKDLTWEIEVHGL